MGEEYGLWVTLGVDLGLGIGWVGRWWVDVELGWGLGVGRGGGEGAARE